MQDTYDADTGEEDTIVYELIDCYERDENGKFIALPD